MQVKLKKLTSVIMWAMQRNTDRYGWQDVPIGAHLDKESLGRG